MRLHLASFPWFNCTICGKASDDGDYANRICMSCDDDKAVATVSKEDFGLEDFIKFLENDLAEYRLKMASFYDRSINLLDQKDDHKWMHLEDEVFAEIERIIAGMKSKRDKFTTGI
jgi:hypothetical protein